MFRIQMALSINSDNTPCYEHLTNFYVDVKRLPGQNEVTDVEVIQEIIDVINRENFFFGTVSLIS